MSDRIRETDFLWWLVRMDLSESFRGVAAEVMAGHRAAGEPERCSYVSSTGEIGSMSATLKSATGLVRRVVLKLDMDGGHPWFGFACDCGEDPATTCPHAAGLVRHLLDNRGHFGQQAVLNENIRDWNGWLARAARPVVYAAAAPRTIRGEAPMAPQIYETLEMHIRGQPSVSGGGLLDLWVDVVALASSADGAAVVVSPVLCSVSRLGVPLQDAGANLEQDLSALLEPPADAPLEPQGGLLYAAATLSQHQETAFEALLLRLPTRYEGASEPALTLTASRRLVPRFDVVDGGQRLGWIVEGTEEWGPVLIGRLFGYWFIAPGEQLIGRVEVDPIFLQAIAQAPVMLPDLREEVSMRIRRCSMAQQLPVPRVDVTPRVVEVSPMPILTLYAGGVQGGDGECSFATLTFEYNGHELTRGDLDQHTVTTRAGEVLRLVRQRADERDAWRFLMSAGFHDAHPDVIAALIPSFDRTKGNVDAWYIHGVDPSIEPALALAWHAHGAGMKIRFDRSFPAAAVLRWRDAVETHGGNL